jgi:hypothetical protein
VLLLEGGTLKGAHNIISRTRIKIGVLGREERAQALDLKKVFHFSKWPMAQRSRWGFVYSPYLKNN